MKPDQALSPALMSSPGAFTGPAAIVPPQRGAGWVPPHDRLAPFGCAVAADASPRRSRNRSTRSARSMPTARSASRPRRAAAVCTSPPMEMDHAAWHPASPLQALSRLRVTAACPRLCRLGAPNYPDLVEVVAVSLAVAALFCLSAVHSWVAPRSPSRTRREVLSQVLGQRPKLTASPSGQADPGAAYYRVIRTRVPSGIPDSRCNAAAGTRTQPLLTAWPNTDRSGQPCRPTVPGPPPKVDSALE